MSLLVFLIVVVVVGCLLFALDRRRGKYFDDFKSRNRR